MEAGDVVKVTDGEQFPCDLLVLTTSEPLADCKIQTANLDGERNLKTRQALTATVGMFERDKLLTKPGEVKLEANCPDYKLAYFKGNLSIAGEKYWVDSKQLLLRGSNLRNTEYIVGMVVYPGPFTKIMMNQKHAPYKISRYEKILNQIVVFELVLQTAICIYLSVSAAMFVEDNKEISYLAQGENRNGLEVGLMAYATFFILLNTMIPISLIISLETVKFLQALTIQYDLDMYCEEKDLRMSVQSINILEELGKIDYMFCDKTGTLTSNVMEFKGCTVAGKVYGGFETQEIDCTSQIIYSPEVEKSIEFESKQVSYSQTPLGQLSANVKKPDEFPVLWNFDETEIYNELVKGSTPALKLELPTQILKLQAEYLREFLIAVALCNDVVATESSGGSLQYLGSSPDEVTLVDAAKQLGFVFLERKPESITLSCFGVVHEFPVLAINEFSSDRKRMSVVVRSPYDNSVRVYMKGADNVMFERLDKSFEEVPFIKETRNSTDFFSRKGLRTLVVAFKVLDEQDAQAWVAKYNQEKCNFEESQTENLKLLAEEVESGMILLGATAVEDKLQESVPEAIEQFSEAGLKMWMLTGDKLETAENIALSCNLVKADWVTIQIESTEESEVVLGLKRAIASAEELNKYCPRNISLIIDGDALSFALSHSDLFYSLCKFCNSIVVSRASPRQKAEVVSFIKQKEPKCVTLAVGDGGNDIPMIQAANVGVGIFGNEGNQAADSSDFAIGKFKFLVPLLFQHGRWTSNRTAFFIQYYFFKNFLFTLPQVYFAFISGFSGQTLYDDWYLLLFNSAITACGVVMYALFDQDLNYKTDPHVKKHLPALYLENRTNEPLTIRKFLNWMFGAFLISMVVFLVPAYMYNKSVSTESGMVEGLWGMSVCIYTSVIFIVNFILIIQIHNWTWIQHVTIWGLSFGLYLLFVVVYNYVPVAYMYGFTFEIISNSLHWATVTLCVACVTIPYYGLTVYKKVFYPTLAERLLLPETSAVSPTKVYNKFLSSYE